jgi:hypothetical protein
MNIVSSLGEQLLSSFSSIGVQVLSWIPNVLAAILVLLIGNYIAKLVQSLIKQLFKTLKIETYAEKLHVSERVKSVGFDVSVTQFIAGLVYWLIFLVFISAAASVLGVEVVTRFINQLINYIPSIFAGLVIMVIGVLVAETLGKMLEKVRHGKLYKTVIKWFILIVAFITAIEQIGINVSFLTENIQIIVGGVSLALGIAFGLGGKDQAKAFLEKHLH